MANKRTALVTGGMGGLGEAICIKLAALGDTVVTTYSPGNTKAKVWLADMKAQGLSLRDMAAKLNADGHTTRRGKPWNPVQVSRVLERSPA